MTRPDSKGSQFLVVWHGALWREIGEQAASLLNPIGRERREDPNRVRIKPTHLSKQWSRGTR
jgi:hypothetical protein